MHSAEISLAPHNVREQLNEWSRNNLPRIRKSWDETWMDRVFQIAERSPDAETQVGAVLLDPASKTLISDGYNGFIRGAKDHLLPNYRKDDAKYPWMIHAEHNAVLNAARVGRATQGAICYSAYKPCQECLQYVYQAGITELVYPKNKKTAKSIAATDELDLFYEIFQFVTEGKLKIREVDYE